MDLRRLFVFIEAYVFGSTAPPINELARSRHRTSVWKTYGLAGCTLPSNTALVMCSYLA